MRSPSPARTPVVALSLAALLAVLAGCGGGSKSSSAPTTTAAPGRAAGAAGGGNRAALAAFRACMAKHGSPLPTFAPRATTGTPPASVPGNGAPPDNGVPPDTGAGPGGGTAPGGAGAAAGSRGFGGGGGIGNVATSTDPAVRSAFAACQSTLPAGFLPQQQQARQQRAAFNSCMKDHGVTLPSGPAPTGDTTTTVDRTSPAYTAAFAVCGQLLPQRPNRTTTTTVAQ
ncbi:MAG: hypothetical protein NVSMB12_20120 [Acidimicrobiales bacterium]